GIKQSAEHVRLRVEAVARAKANWTDERRQQWAARISANNPMRSLETRVRMANAKRGRPSSLKGKPKPSQAGEKHPMFGKRHTPEALAKMRLAHSGKKQSPEF